MITAVDTYVLRDVITADPTFGPASRDRSYFPDLTVVEPILG